MRSIFCPREESGQKTSLRGKDGQAHSVKGIVYVFLERKEMVLEEKMLKQRFLK